MKKLKIKYIIAFICMFIFFIIISLLIMKHSYTQTVESVLPTSVEYNGIVIERALNSDYYALLNTSKRTLYFGEFSDTQKIQIIIPGKVTINVYPNDTESVLISYDPHGFGITRNYKLSGYGNFNQHLETLYDLTGNEVFNKTIELPEAK